MTNKNWYSYPEFGSHYKLEDDYLMFCPTNIDGTPDIDSSGEVDMPFMKEESLKDYERLLEIKNELKTKK